VLSRLPPLPAVIKYYDEFTERYYSIEKVSEREELDLTYGGFDMTLRLSRFSPSLSILLKHVLLEMNSREVNMHAIAVRITSVVHLTQEEIADVAFSSPESIGQVWTRLLTEKRINTLVATKEILRVLCTNRIGGWSPSYGEYISKSLVLPQKDKYAFLRSGNAFLTVEQESLTVSLIDDACNLTRKSRETLTLRDLNDVAMLICAFQFGMRPTQIARVKVDEVRHRISDSDGTTSVHISFPMIPVVPFITHQSARNLTTQLLRNVRHSIDPELIDLASRFVPDMRLLKNVRNEFLVFRDRIFSSGPHAHATLMKAMRTTYFPDGPFPAKN